MAFTETQLFHLLKILTNETMSLAYSTMEKMILEALIGKPTTKQSRTDHFRVRGRAQTPRPEGSSGSSFESASGSDFLGQVGAELGHESVASCEESDGATEMALITASSNKSTIADPPVSASRTLPTATSADEFESSGFTSHDVTLSEIREQTKVEKTQTEPPSKKVKKIKRMPHRAVLMSEESFRNID